MQSVYALDCVDWGQTGRVIFDSQVMHIMPSEVLLAVAVGPSFSPFYIELNLSSFLDYTTSMRVAQYLRISSVKDQDWIGGTVGVGPLSKNQPLAVMHKW